MLEITIPGSEFYNEATGEFCETADTVLQLEHSLISVSKWESKWNLAFLNQDAMTYEQTIDYIRDMTINKNVDPKVYYRIDDEIISKVNEYISRPMTATTISEKNGKKGGKQIITSEIIYYWMISLEIPFECQKWHLNRLLTLIRVCDIKNNPKGNKMGKKEAAMNNKALNAARRAKSGSRG